MAAESYATAKRLYVTEDLGELYRKSRERHISYHNESNEILAPTAVPKLHVIPPNSLNKGKKAKVLGPKKEMKGQKAKV